MKMNIRAFKKIKVMATALSIIMLSALEISYAAINLSSDIKTNAPTSEVLQLLQDQQVWCVGASRTSAHSFIIRFVESSSRQGQGVEIGHPKVLQNGSGRSNIIIDRDKLSLFVSRDSWGLGQDLTNKKTVRSIFGRVYKLEKWGGIGSTLGELAIDTYVDASKSAAITWEKSFPEATSFQELLKSIEFMCNDAHFPEFQPST